MCAVKRYGVTFHLLQQFTVLNVDLLPSEYDLALANVVKFFLVGSYNSRIV